MRRKEKGSVLLIVAVAFFLVILISGSMLILRSRTSSRSGISETIVTQGLEIADVGIQQMLGDIHRRSITPATLQTQRDDLEIFGKITEINRYYQVKKSTDTGYVLWVTTATLTLVPYQNDPFTRKAVTDIEDNPLYKIVSRSTIYSLNGEEMAHKTVQAAVSIINLAKYGAVNIGTYRSGWYPDKANIFDGFMHINPDLNIHGFNFANALYLPIDISNLDIDNGSYPGYTTRYYKNPFYSPKYTVVVAGHIKKMDYHPSCDYRVYTQFGLNTATLVTIPLTPAAFEATYTKRAYYSHNYTGADPAETLIGTNHSYTIVDTASNPRGTWFDGTHGGFKLNVLALDYTFFRSNADVIINLNDLGNCKIRNPISGATVATFNGTSLVIDLHDGPEVSNHKAIDINLGALGTGSSQDVFGAGSFSSVMAMNYYNQALDDDGDHTPNDRDDYGLVIYVNGWVAIHGKLAESDHPNINQNKKITVISAQGVNIIGDILYSGDSYFQVLDPANNNANWVANGGNIAVVNTPGQNIIPFNPSPSDYRTAGEPRSLKVSMNRGGKEGVPRSGFIRTNCLVTAPTTYHNINDGVTHPFDIPNNKIALNIYLGENAPFSQARMNLQLSRQNNNLIRELPLNDSEQIIINEICYSPAISSDSPWVELYNRHPTTIYNLRDWKFYDGQAIRPMSNISYLKRGDGLLGPGEYALLVKNWTAFSLRYNILPSNLDIIELSGMDLPANGNPGISLVDPNDNFSEPQYAYTHPTLTVSGNNPHPDWRECSWERVNYYSTLPGIWEVNKNQSLYSDSSKGIGTPGYQNLCFRSWSRVIVTGLTATESADLNDGRVSLIFSDYSNGTVSKSNNNGNTWGDTGLSTATIYALAIDPNTAEPSLRLYAGTGGMGVFKTTSSGNTWRRLINNIVLTNENVYCLAIDSTTAEPNLRLYAGTERNGVHRSVDSGETWIQLGLATHTVYALSIDPNAVQTLYAGTRDGLLQTITGGDSPADWSPVGGGLLAGTTVYAVSMNGSNRICIGTRGRGVYYTNNGTNWFPSATGLTVGTTIYTLTREPGTDIIYAGTARGIFKTTDNGLNWADITTTLPVNTPIFSIAHKSAGKLLFVGTNNGLYKGLDDGSNWDIFNPHLSGSFVNALVTPGGNNIYAGTSSDVDFIVDELNFSLGKSYPVNARFERLGHPRPNPANLYNDAIAIISNDNIYVDLWSFNRRGHFDTQPASNWAEDGRHVPPEYESSRFFVNNGDYQLPKYPPNDQTALYYSGMKLSCFFYFNTDLTGMRAVQLTKSDGTQNPRQQMVFITRYGTTISKSTGYNVFYEGQDFYDADLEENISPIIPIGTGIHSWQQIEGK